MPLQWKGQAVDHVLILRDPSTAKTIQVWGPFESEDAARTARDEFSTWPALGGEWDIAPMVRPVDEPPPAAPHTPILPYYPPQYQPLPNHPHWQQPGWVYCTGTNANTQLLTVTPEMQARATTCSGAFTPPSFWSFTSSTSPDGVMTWTLDRTVLTDGPGDEDPPAAVAATI